MDRAVVRLRLAALDQAVRVVAAHEANSGDVVALAQTMFEWLTTPATPVRLTLVVGPVTRQGVPQQHENEEQNTVQIHDDEQFSLTVQATDAKGFPTTDPNLSWSVDNADVLSLVVSEDKQSATVVAGVPGSAVVTLTDGTLTVTEAVDVVPGGVALITLTEGTVEKQAPAAPAPVEEPAPVVEAPVEEAPVTEEPAPVADPAPVDTNPAGSSAI
jgi:hypothetical protein